MLPAACLVPDSQDDRIFDTPYLLDDPLEKYALHVKFFSYPRQEQWVSSLTLQFS